MRTTHQRVIATRWWSWWSTKGREGKIYIPTNRHDSLVVDEGPGGREQRTNESLGLVGGRGGRQRARRARTTHQRVVVTRWWSTKGREDKNNAPTSRRDSLVVDEGPGGREQRTNKSSGLVGGGGGRRRTGRARTTHQQVVVTRWWSMKGWEGEVTAPTSRHDSLVVMVVDEGPGGREQHTNKSSRLVGGCGSR